VSRPNLEVADIFRRHGAAWRATNAGHLSAAQLRVMTAIEACRTAALGGHVERCEQCAHMRVAYNSCRNRHCPKCQARAAAEWLEARSAELLPVPYFHVVFTLPATISAIAYQNKAALYGLLFAAAAEALTTIAADPKHLGAEIGVTAVLHTWGQNLDHHPHVHCIVPGGGIAPDGSRWVACRPGFFLPVRVLSRLFRRLFLQGLEALHGAGKLQFFGELEPLTARPALKAHLDPLQRVEWVVYAKPPFAGPAQVLAYLARYTHRVAIANSRLVELGDDQVSFRWKDYRENGRHKIKVMRLAAGEFIPRFLMHTLPNGFHRIRYYGFAADGHRSDKLAQCRRLLEVLASASEADDIEPADNPSPLPCPCCGGRMIIVEQFAAMHSTFRIDSS
jgi:putative transposase/transposase-like zinc-binding protein